MLLKYTKLYLEFLKQNIKIMLEYRADFIIGLISSVLERVGTIIFIWIIFNNIGDIKGWSFYEVTFLYGLMILSLSINGIFFDNLWMLGREYINPGKFDLLLLRPISPLFHLIANKLYQDSIGTFIFGLILIIKSLFELNIKLGLLDIFMLIIFMISGGLIIAAINLMATTSSFWVVRSNLLIWSVYTLNEFALYPITIYKKGIVILITCIFPYAFASFYPSNYFLHKGYEQFSLLSPFVAIVLWVIAIRVWNFGLKNYVSTGS